MFERTTPARSSVVFLALALILALGTISWNYDLLTANAQDSEPSTPGNALDGSASKGNAPVSAASDNQTIQLTELLDTASIVSPLLDLKAASALEELTDSPVDLLLDEGFEDFEFEFEGWPKVSWASVSEEQDGRVLRLEGVSRSARLGWVLPVHSDSLYRFERSVRVLGKPFCDLYVVESRLDFDDAQPDPEQYFLAGRGAALKVHSLPLQSGTVVGDIWQRASTSFYPTPRTRSLVVIFRPRVGADPRATVRSMSFDDVRLEEVLPTRKDRIRLLKGSHLAIDADPARGMRKQGLLLPLPSPGGVQTGEAAESNYDWRSALYAPPTTELAFKLQLPEGARLRLATGLARETPLKAAARFQIELLAPGATEPKLLLDQERTARMEEWSWDEVDLDLSPWAGSEVTLVLRTLSEKGDPHPLWANPRIEAAGEASDPMVILIAVDTLRADHLSSYGYERATSPSLDRLAADGVRFDQARSNCNWTCPSFASIFTGLVPSRHGVSSYGPATPLPTELVTLAEHFQAEGWNTRSIAYKVPLFDGNYEQGFDRAFNVPRDFIRGEENLARALEWLETHRGGPSFLFLHFNDPHQPFVQPEPFDRTFGPAPEGLGLGQPFPIPSDGGAEGQQMTVDLYDGAVSYVDSCIGQFLDALRERGLYEHATIAFVADHGEQLFERGGFGHGGANLFDEVVRVPLIVKASDARFQPGQVITTNVSGFDVMPTLLDLVGIEAAGKLDARSLVPLMSGTEQSLDRVVVTETSARGLALVDGDYKYVLEPGGSIESLFNLRKDPRELENIAEQHEEQLAHMRKLAIAYLLEHRPGNYLLLHGDEPVRLQLSTRAVRTLVGPSLSLKPASASAELTVQMDPGTWGLLAVEDPDPETVVINGLEPRGSEDGFGPWVAGGLPHLKGQGVWRVRGPQPRGGRSGANEDADPDPVDEELMEALRRLGYVE